jgi:hypothetical protein
MVMTLNEAVAELESIMRDGIKQTVFGEDIECADTEQAIRLLANAYDHLRNRHALYGERHRSRSLGPPPSSVPPG